MTDFDPTTMLDFNLLAEGHQDAILVMSAELRYLYLNSAAERLLNRDRNDLLGRLLLDVYPNARNSSAFYEPAMQALREQVTITIEGKLTVADRWFEVRFHPFGRVDPGTGATGIAVYCRDITERKQAEEEARRSEQVWRNMADALPQIVWASGPLGDVQFVNRAFRDYSGLSDTEAAEKGFHSILHPDDLPGCQEVVTDAVAEGRPWQHECRLRRAGDGQSRWHLSRCTPAHDAKGEVTGWFGVATDIHDHRVAEDALRETEERLRLSLDAAQMGTWDFDFSTGLGWLSEQSLRLFDLPLDRPATPFEEWERAINEADRPQVTAAFEASIRSGAPYCAVYRTVCPADDGGERWIASTGRITTNDQGRPVRGLGTNRDITVSRRTEERLREAEERLSAAVEAVEAGIFLVDCATGQKQYSPKTFSLLGIAPPMEFTRPSGGITAFAPVAPQDFWAQVHLDDREKVEEALRRAYSPASGAGGLYVAEYRVLRPEGETRWIGSKGRVTFDAAGHPQSLIGLLRDVTEIRRERDKQARISETVQHSLLLVPSPDAYPGITVETLYQSARDDALVGGDFFDVFAVSEDVVALVIGDATGKGVEAATYTAEIKFALRAFLREHDGSLLTAIRLLNKFVVANQRLDAAHSDGYYVALAAVLVNTRTGAVTCCCAGAEPPLILRAATGDWEEACAFGPLLGVSPDAPYQSLGFSLEAGDLIALVTDGITEARRPRTRNADGKSVGGEFFGIDGLASALQKEAADPARPLADVKQAVVGRALHWADGQQQDDICLLLAKRL